MRSGIANLAQRFWAKVNKSSDRECWNWSASKTRGYGTIGDGNGKVIYAHRLSWKLHFGDVPDGLHVLHQCDNRACVNPGHLFVGTHADNMHDMKKKLRGGSGRRKLTDDDVRFIISLHNDGRTNVEIARQFNVQQPAISKVLNGKTPRYAYLAKDVTGTGCEQCVAG